MTLHDMPLVSVVTPVYNGEDFLAECIESVLRQTYENYEYHIVNNCSTDRSLEIALDYATKDGRVRVHANKQFVGVMENHNIALGLIAPAAKYCKVVGADDFLFPECLMKMVELAEGNRSVGMVGSYSLAGRKITNSGLEYERKVVSGKEICRATLLGGPYVFGAPTSLLYRADLVRKPKGFYPNSNPHCDTTACYQLLEYSDFGFVHQVLSYTRIHAASQTSKSLKYGIINLAVLDDFCRFAPKYLTRSEVRRRLALLLDNYYQSLVPNIFEQSRNREFWQRQKSELGEMGLRFSLARLLKTAFLRGARLLLTPGQAFKKVSGLRMRPGRIQARYYED
jgi:glycosyltransferase involved in cell wall biosynthesis